MQLSRDDTNWLKGIAVVLMMCHHLFAFPERILPPATYIPLWPGVDFEGTLAQFGKICVPLFLFLSGYGIACSAQTDWRSGLSRAWRFMSQYWFYFACLMPIGILWFPELRAFDSEAQRFNPAPSVLLPNLLGISSTYNGEWWFVEPYLLLVLASPLLLRALLRPAVLASASLLLFVAGAILLGRHLDTRGISLTGLAYWQWPFVAGMMVRGTALPCSLAQMARPMRLLLAAGLVLSLWLGLDKAGLVLATPLFAWLCTGLRPAGRKADAAIQLVGRYSLPVWLVHSFLCYYYAQTLVFAPRYSPLVLVNLLLLSLLAAMLLEAVRLRVFQLFSHLFAQTSLSSPPTTKSTS
ncbi:MAG TPA: acyltransferase [Rhodocyclaceae bacterium]|nr:acyltransferase [Rhodocyclaceae bacterium]